MSDRRSDKEIGENSNSGISKVQMNALLGHITRLMRSELEPVHARLDQLQVIVASSV